MSEFNAYDERDDIAKYDGHFTLDDIKWMDVADWPIWIRCVEYDENGKPSTITSEKFTSPNLDALVVRLSELSLTHSIMFVRHGFFYLREDKEHQTNITSEVLDTLLVALKSKPQWMGRWMGGNANDERR